MKRNRPTIGTSLTALLVSLLHWGVSSLPETVPAEVTTSLLGFGAVLVAIAVGLVTQYVGKHAPWAAETHKAAVAYAVSLDPEAHADDLQYLGVGSLEEARRIIGAEE